MTDGKKPWAWAVAVLVLLAIIVVGATLIGVYMTQKHIEEVVQMAFEAKNGEKIQQTVMVNNGENVAAFYVNSNNVSSTVLYDYSHDFIGFRRMNSPKCFVVEMNDMNIPSMRDILRVIKHFQRQNATSDTDLTYELVEGEEADRTKLGVPINILCSDVPIHWATQNKSPRLRWKITLKFNIFGIDLSFTYES
ncbi:gastrokine-2-like isoform 2-T4 [Anomaloglossus baeobatrachus]|uniref:gastrokine-2-like n=1 Tax=Anomaloglossus baeobatrachus TaxID=238106 RepID=UPI003F4F71F5